MASCAHDIALSDIEVVFRWYPHLRTEALSRIVEFESLVSAERLWHAIAAIAEGLSREPVSCATHYACGSQFK